MNEKMNRIESLYNMLYKETDEIYGKLAHFFGMTSTAFWLLYFYSREKPLHAERNRIPSLHTQANGKFISQTFGKRRVHPS